MTGFKGRYFDYAFIQNIAFIKKNSYLSPIDIFPKFVNTLNSPL